jgi:uncharacterized lipoprotein YmbA
MTPRSVALLTVSAGVLTGCVSLNKPYPVKESFGLTPTAAQPAARTQAGILRVERVRVAPPYDSRSFVHRLSDGRYEPDYYHEFVADPDRLLTAELVRMLAEARAFSTVVEPAATLETPMRLETSVTELYADIRDAAKPRAVIRARFLLLEDRLDSTSVLGEWALEASEAAASGDAAALAEAWSRGWGKIITQLGARMSGAATNQ